MTDIFDIQDEISLAIADALKLQLSEHEKVQMTDHGTNDSAAYQLYLKGLLNFHKFTPGHLQKAIKYFDEAIELNPSYAKAHAGLVQCYHISWVFGFLPPERSLPPLQKAAAKAIEIDDQIAESNMAMGRVKLWYEFDYEEAEIRFQKSLQVNPNNPDTLGQYGLLLALTGNKEKALQLGAKAKELDPFSPLGNVDKAWIQLLCGKSESLLEQSLHMVDLFPNFWISHSALGYYFWTKSQYDEAIIALEMCDQLNHGWLTISVLGTIYAVSGKKDKARKMLTDLYVLNAEMPVPNFNFAIIYAALEEMDKAYEYLEKSWLDRAGHLCFLNLYRRDLIPSFKENSHLLEFMDRVGIPHFD